MANKLPSNNYSTTKTAKDIAKVRSVGVKALGMQNSTIKIVAQMVVHTHGKTGQHGSGPKCANHYQKCFHPNERHWGHYMIGPEFAHNAQTCKTHLPLWQQRLPWNWICHVKIHGDCPLQ